MQTPTKTLQTKTLLDSTVILLKQKLTNLGFNMVVDRRAKVPNYGYTCMTNFWNLG
jgi:hypothetical protein